MAKRKRMAPQMQREGRQQATGSDYESFIKVQDIPSKGRATRTTHPKAPWVANLLSDIETSYRVALEWSDYVETMYDQHALELIETLEISELIGVKHPTNPKTKEPSVMTSDFVIETTDGRTIVWSVKPHNKISMRDIEKLEIERIYWTRRGASWWLVTENDILDVLVKNVMAVRKTVFLDDYGISLEQANKVRRLAERHMAKEMSMSELGELTDEMLGYSVGTSLTVFRYLIATKQWVVDMTKPLDTAEPLAVDQIVDSDADNSRRRVQND